MNAEIGEEAVVTRSVEIPEAAVRSVAKGLEQLTWVGPAERIAAAEKLLDAALPHLAPAGDWERVGEVLRAHQEDSVVDCMCGWRDRDSDIDLASHQRDALFAAGAIRESAVPQSVDREALRKMVAAIDAVEIGAGSEHYKHGRETMRDDAISAIQDLVLAGEQEQVER